MFLSWGHDDAQVNFSQQQEEFTFLVGCEGVKILVTAGGGINGKDPPNLTEVFSSKMYVSRNEF